MKDRIKIIYLSLLSVAFVGVCFFFPLQIEGGYTCLFQYAFNLDYGVDEQQIVSSSIMHSVNHNTTGSGLDVYLRHYAFLWWISLSLFVLSFYLLYKARNKHGFNCRFFEKNSKPVIKHTK